MDNHDESTLVAAHLPCPDCGSSDALSEYSDGHTYCFSCGVRKGGNAKTKTTKTTDELIKANPGKLINGEFRELASRRISLETCKKTGYQVGTYKGESVHIANYFNEDGEVIAQKIRGKDKKFEWTGTPKKAGLYMQHMWKGYSRKLLVMVEGEIDANSLYEITKGQRFAIVSVENGAQSALKSVQNAIRFVEEFEKVVFMFDNDEPGRAAAKECARVLSPGKAFIASLPLKDANDMLKEGRSAEVLTAVGSALPFRPDGIVSGKEISQFTRAKRVTPFASFPWEFLNKQVGGLYEGDLITLGAGSGCGKTSFMAEIAYHLAQNGISVGIMFMEESLQEVGLRFQGYHLNKVLWNGRDEATDDELVAAEQATTDNETYNFYDHQGESSIDATLDAMRFLIHAKGVKVIFLDNLSTIVAGMGDENERIAIDKMVRGIFNFAQRERVAIFLASHLTNPMGNKGFDQGLEINQKSFRGSGSIASNSTLMLGLERTVGSNEPTKVRVVKSRKFGSNAGVRGFLRLDEPTGRLREASEVSPFPTGYSGGETNSDFE